MRFEVGCYYFPNYHTGDPRNELQHGPGWSEWALVRSAVPRFAGHQQPRQPLWDYEDEKLPGVMKRKIDAAADAGIDFFIFDWYYYDDGPFLERALEEGFLHAPNRDRLKFCTMWANHDWTDIHPATRFSPRTVLYPGRVSRATFEKIAQIHLERYFPRPEYYKIDGAPYFSIYDLGKLLASFGSVAGTRRALDDFRAETKRAGFPGLHLNLVAWGSPLLPGEATVADLPKVVDELGFDSVTSYVWKHEARFPAWGTMDYRDFAEQYFEFYEKARRIYRCEYFPNLTVGWDSSPRLAPSEVWEPRVFKYPCGPIVTGRSPELFRAAARRIKDTLAASGQKHKIVTVNSWNEWTESSYLEPDDLFGTGYLDVMREEFAGS